MIMSGGGVSYTHPKKTIHRCLLHVLHGIQRARKISSVGVTWFSH